MYGHMLYKSTIDHFVSKGYQAQKDLFHIFFKARICNIESRLHLFDCLVKSVFLYCSHIWGVSVPHRIKMFQMQFLRKLFNLPSYTQHWFLMMESQSKFIEVSFLKNVLFYWTKILSKPKNSLVRNCYDALKLSKDKYSMKLNWYRDFSKL
jgi:hypothetical protein